MTTAVLKRVRIPVLLTGALLWLAGCADDAELDTLEPRGENAADIDTLSNGLFIAAGVVFLIILGASLWLVVKYRVREYSDDDWPEQVHGINSLEIGWTIVPAVIMAVIGVFTMVTLFGLYDDEANAITVDTGTDTVQWEPHVVVVGQQWWWEYRYYFDGSVLDSLGESDIEENSARDLPPADIITAGQMVIPVGEEVELSILSRDVIHSHWIPALNGKRDAMPGRVTPWEVSADRPGVYFGQCTEFCGLSHSRMRMQVVAVTEENFQTWVDQQMGPAGAPSQAAAAWLDSVADDDPANDLPAPDSTPEERGLVAFTQNCAGCHLIDGVNDTTYMGADQVSGAAPNLTHFASRTTFAGGILDTYEITADDFRINETDLARWLRNPSDIKAMDPDREGARRGMPNLGLDEDTIDDLIAYLATLGQVPGGESTVIQTEVE